MKSVRSPAELLQEIPRPTGPEVPRSRTGSSRAQAPQDRKSWNLAKYQSPQGEKYQGPSQESSNIPRLGFLKTPRTTGQGRENEARLFGVRSTKAPPQGWKYPGPWDWKYQDPLYCEAIKGPEGLQYQGISRPEEPRLLGARSTKVLQNRKYAYPWTGRGLCAHNESAKSCATV